MGAPGPPAAGSGPAEAFADAAPGAAPAETAAAIPAPHRSKPMYVMLRSAVLPGWGQMYNRKYIKGLGVIAGEGFLAYKAWDEFQKEQDAADRISLADTIEDDAAREAALAEATADRDQHMNQKINWIWWGVAAHLLQMVDAYVDAHLSTFEADFGPTDAESGAGTEPRLTIALRTRF